MTRLASIAASLLLLAVVPVSAGPLPLDVPTTFEDGSPAFETVTPLAPTELAQLTGAASDWVEAGCAIVAGGTLGWSIGRQLARRVVIGVVCPACGWVLIGAIATCMLLPP